MPADNELELYINNDGHIYRELTRPLQQRLANAKASGTYDRLRALKGFDAVVTEGVRRYRREFPGSSFSTADRKNAARGMLEYFETEHRLGNIKPDLPASGKSAAQLAAEIAKVAPPRRRVKCHHCGLPSHPGVRCV